MIGNRFFKLTFFCFILINLSSCDLQNSNLLIDKVASSQKDIEIFKAINIPLSVKKRMDGKSMKHNSQITYENLAYVQVAYIDFNEETKVGELIVHKKVADEIVAIFKELYIKRYPIARMTLIDEFNANDEQSMLANNTSAFCYRMIAGTNYLSNHAKGYAIDINPFQNPHILNNQTFPTASFQYKNREKFQKGMIIEGDDCYKAFTSRGWGWGGHWKNPDYQHFEKVLN